jgi:hypothetical protein
MFHPLRKPTLVEQLTNRQPLTQFGWAIEELVIPITKALSPQAKNRTEHFFRVPQDRLVVEMRLSGVSTLVEGNQALDVFLQEYNHRFTNTPRNKESLFRKPPTLPQLDCILCLKQYRTVNKDHTISL